MTRAFGTSVSGVAAGLLAALCLAGCGRTTPVEEGNRRGILRVGTQSDYSDIDPATAIDVEEDWVLGSLCEGLVRRSADGTRIEPAVAERWTVSEDGLTYTFLLRKAARWSNGSPVTAPDFVYAFRRVFDPRLACEKASWGYAIVGAQACVEGEGRPEAIGVSAPDDHTFVVRLLHPAADFMAVLAMSTPFCPVYRPSVERFGGAHTRGTGWTKPGAFVSNGAFQLTSWELDRMLVVTKNPYYWDAGHVALSGIEFHPVEDPVTREHGFRSGQYHLTRSVPQVTPDRSGPSERFLTIEPGAGGIFLTFNVAVAPFSDPRVRRALSLAIDRDKLVAATLGELAVPASTYAKPGLGGYGTQPPSLFDPEGARRLLAEAGFAQGHGFPVVPLMLTATTSDQRRIGEVIQADWQGVLGVATQLEPTEQKVYLDAERTKHFTVVLEGWWPPWPDPEGVYQTIETGNPNNDSGWSSPKADALYHEAGASLSREQRARDFEGIEALISQEVPYAPLYFKNYSGYVLPSVRGWTPSGLQYSAFRAYSVGP